MWSKSGGYLVLGLALSIFLVLSLSHKAEGYYYDIVSVNNKNDTNTSIQQDLDALYPIARYAGMGYNILKGNPEGDFNHGGRDPGIHKTRWIFNLTYTSDKKGRYGNKTVAVPDQVEFHPTQSCASQSRTKAYSGQTSYQKQLQLNIGGGLSGGFSKLVELGFSLSGGMQQVERKTKDSREVIVQETKICNLGSVRYKDELVFDGRDEYVLSAGFRNDVKKLPNTVGSAYYKFIERWGTHVILSAEVGTRSIERQSASYSEVYSYLSKQKNFGTSTKLGGGVNGFGASGNFNIDLSSLNDNVNGKTKIGHSKTTLTIGSEKSPAPIKLDLIPLTEALTELMWGPGWKDNGIAEKQKSLATALLRYPSITRAHVNKDPAITITPMLTWLSGEFALPEPSSECPEGFNRGCIRQDTYNLITYNSWSSEINNRLRCDVNETYITTCFCVKEEHPVPHFNEPAYAWPKGSYCIARKGESCPDGFPSDGFIKWDDKDLFNKNGRNGELPDGEYDTNTKIFFCCRSDGSSNKPMRMPTQDPFVLYRYQGRCQKVKGMTVQEDYIEWVDEIAFNQDDTGGAHPDNYSGKGRRQKLRYCHYSTKK